MKAMIKIVTNNPLTKEHVEKLKKENPKKENVEVRFVDGDYIDVLKYVRDNLHQNHKLLTHPLASNFLPDKTFYKSIIMQECIEMDASSILLLEDAMTLANEALKARSRAIFETHILADLRFVDFEVIKHSVDRLFN